MIFTDLLFGFEILWIEPLGINIVSCGFLKKDFLLRTILGLPSTMTQCSDL